MRVTMPSVAMPSMAVASAAMASMAMASMASGVQSNARTELLVGERDSDFPIGNDFTIPLSSFPILFTLLASR